MAGEIIEGQATYWGGHFLYPPSKNGDSGNLILSKDEIVFEKSSFFGVKWKIEIPVKRVIWKKVSQNVGEDVTYKQKMTAITYFAGYGPMTSMSRNTTFITIPFKDEKGVEQAPRFSMNKQRFLEEVSKFIYENMPREK